MDWILVNYTPGIVTFGFIAMVILAIIIRLINIFDRWIYGYGDDEE